MEELGKIRQMGVSFGNEEYVDVLLLTCIPWITTILPKLAGIY